MKEGQFTPHVKLVIRSGGRGFFGPGVAELMERIEETGSVKEACRAMEMSYSKGRAILKRAEKTLGFPLIETIHGGCGGGSSSITDRGRTYLRAYRLWEEEVAAYTGESFRRLMNKMD